MVCPVNRFWQVYFTLTVFSQSRRPVILANIMCRSLSFIAEARSLYRDRKQKPRQIKNIL